ncbi:MAG TPA: O-methyltransferase [Bacteroidales bacterium]|jgi:predicted O-methyltransferase YrrM|nr:O-methyltransferase [Bacteroidales bacterium]HNV95767.1 O-methyltransferase [Bacteroidales bacterium]HOU98082.1 O-methyltransferase [Bacteroidales bacterium]
MDSIVQKYVIEHTEEESELLRELERETNVKIYHPRMLSGHLQGKLLKMFSMMIAPYRILEIGTYTGYSALCLAEGLLPGGILHTIEINDELEEFIRLYINRSPLSSKIKLHIGNALNIIPGLDETFDLVFIDGDKREYLEYYQAIFDKVRQGGFIIADNVLWNGKVFNENENDEFTKSIRTFNDYVHYDTRVENVMLPLRDGMMILRKR